MMVRQMKKDYTEQKDLRPTFKIGFHNLYGDIFSTAFPKFEAINHYPRLTKLLGPPATLKYCTGLFDRGFRR